jgi:hypothetical protein
MVMGGVVLMLRSAQHQGANYMFLAGSLALAEFICVSRFIPWSSVLDDVRTELQPDSVELLDHVLGLNASLPQ